MLNDMGKPANFNLTLMMNELEPMNNDVTVIFIPTWLVQQNPPMEPTVSSRDPRTMSRSLNEYFHFVGSSVILLLK